MTEDTQNQKVEACSICAWRADCKKKFSLSGKNIRCPDFVRDLTIKDPDATAPEEGTSKEKVSQ